MQRCSDHRGDVVTDCSGLRPGNAMRSPPLIPTDRSWPRPKLYSYPGSRYHPKRLCFRKGQNMKSTTASAASAFLDVPNSLVYTQDGPMPAMTSAFFERVQGFLNRTSVPHSVEYREKLGVTPISISSQPSIGSNSRATVGPPFDVRSVRFRPAEAPISRTAVGPFPPSSAGAPGVRNNARISNRARVRVSRGLCMKSPRYQKLAGMPRLDSLTRTPREP